MNSNSDRSATIVEPLQSWLVLQLPLVFGSSGLSDMKSGDGDG